MTAIVLRIVVLQLDTDVWCDVCGLHCATTVSHVEESGDGTPESVHRLDYCERCEER